MSLKICSVEACDRPLCARGLCRAHYMRLWSGKAVGEDAIYAISKPQSDVLTPERLRELLCYDSETGIFTWRRSEGVHKKQGKVAGHSDGCWGYRQISVDGKIYLEHRLVFLYVNGRWPQAELDHRDLNKTNNAYYNLREAKRIENAKNIHVRKDSASQIKGVHRMPSGRWQVVIRANNVRYCIGTYNTIDEASAAYKEAAIRLHGEFARAQ